MIREEYLNFIQGKVVAIAEAILKGDMGIIVGSRKLNSLRFTLDLPNDEDFNLFVVIDSDTDHLPVDWERQNWSAEALARKDVEIAECEKFYRESVIAACKKLIVRFNIEP